MSILIVIDNPKDWPLNIDGVEVVPARRYLTDPSLANLSPAKVFNLCKSYRYQSLGYYVSLLAAARGHKPLPDIQTIQDLKASEMVRIAGEEVEELIQASLAKEHDTQFTLSIYFGQNIEKRYNKLALALFNMFPAPFLRAQFRHDGDHWRLESVRTIGASDIPPDHFLFVLTCATQYFNRPHRRSNKQARFDLAILHTKTDPTPPSNEKAIKRFVRAAESMGMDVEIIDKDDYGRLAEFDALFIRDTTAVNHFTFRFARRAAAAGLVVIDDPESIVKCSNKVYLAELLQHHRIPSPSTIVIHRDNWEDAPAKLGFPLVLKQPDSQFSLGVVKAADPKEYAAHVDRLFKTSDLLIGQSYTPTEYDWRIGMLDREPLFACKYYMAGDHWQIRDASKTGDAVFGKAETWPLTAVPGDVLKAAIRISNLIGDGLYGVDIKEVAGKPLVIEINDNPNIDSGVEDDILGDELYLRVMRVFLKRLESRGR